MRFISFLKKECLLLSRDLHGLALLFVMPVLFILIMSLAMQNTFSEHGVVEIDYLLVNEDEADAALTVVRTLENDKHFASVEMQGGLSDIRQALASDKIQFLVTIPDGFSSSLDSSPLQIIPMRVEVAPGTQSSTLLLFESRLKEITGGLFADRLAKRLGASGEGFDSQGLSNAVSIESASTGSEILPSSVQQNVPAWLVFSMFFIAIPVSTTLLGERAQGTLARIVTLGASTMEFLSAKLLTYMLINLIQVILMFLVGRWLVPILGGDSLTLGNAPLALALVAVAISFAAVSFALLISTLAQTTDQATVMAGLFNIILAAIGGVMVPRFIMPEAMQKFSLLSPHAWGLEGFLDIILRGGGIVDVLPEVSLLFVFGAVMLVLSLFLFKRHYR